MIFGLYERVAISLGDERYIFDQRTLMYPEAAEIEAVTKLSYAEWALDLAGHKITAIAALLHVLRQRAGVPTDFAKMTFAAAALDVVPVHDDDREYTREEIAADVERRFGAAKAGAEPVPTRAANGQASPSAATVPATRKRTSPRSRATSASGRGSGTSSPTGST